MNRVTIAAVIEDREEKSTGCDAHKMTMQKEALVVSSLATHLRLVPDNHKSHQEVATAVS